MTINRDYDNMPPLLFRLQEETLDVNSPKSQPEMRHQSQLHFYVINISQEKLILSGKSGFSIELNITIGEGGSNMFTPHDDTGWGTIGSTDYFDVIGFTIHPLKKNNLHCTLKLKADRTVVLQPGLGCSFTWRRIVSTAPEGYAVVQANIFGLANSGAVGGKLSQSDYIFKKAALPRIVQFSASPSSGALGQQVTLKWRVENAEKGILLPDGYDIMGPVPQQSGSRNITLTKEIDRYYLNLIGNDIGVFQEAHVFLAPPVISDFYIDDHNNICWETYYASRVLLKESMQFQEVAPSGTLPLQKQVTQVALLCEGLYQVERQLIIPPAEDMLTIYAEYQTYQSHRLVKLSWESEGLRDFTVIVGDGDSYILSTQPSGTWEQSYLSTERIVFIFYYTAANGNKVQLQLEKKGETV